MNLRPLNEELNQVLPEEDQSGTKSSLEERDQKVLQDQKGEHTFTKWLHHYEVSEPSYPENLMKEAIVGSLCGNACESIRRLGPRVPVFKIVETLKKKYQSRTNPDLVMQEFYKINQSPKETMMDFGTRLHSTLTKIRTNHPNLVSELE